LEFWGPPGGQPSFLEGGEVGFGACVAGGGLELGVADLGAVRRRAAILGHPLGGRTGVAAGLVDEGLRMDQGGIGGEQAQQSSGNQEPGGGERERRGEHHGDADCPNSLVPVQGAGWLSANFVAAEPSTAA